MNNSTKSIRDSLSTRAAKLGGYSFFLTLIVLAILIAANVLVKKLPVKYTEFDVSSSKLYSVTSSTKAVVGNIKEDVTIYWIVQSGQEDQILQRLLEVYKGLSEHIKVVIKNPDIFPTFAAQYTEETVYNNSLVVECGERSRFIGYLDIYLIDTSSYYYTQSVTATGFDAEGQITSAISFVTSDTLPKIAVLTGHSERTISGEFENSITKGNFETEQINLLTMESIDPEEYAFLLIYAPTADITEDELAQIRAYLAAGGKLLTMSGMQEGEDLTNLKSILNDYGYYAREGIVLDSDKNYYTLSRPYALLPDVLDTEIGGAILQNNNHVIVPIAQSIAQESTPSGVTPTALLETSGTSYNKEAGYAITSYDQEEADVEGPFRVAYQFEDSNTGAQVVWIGSDEFVSDGYINSSAGANSDFVMNAMHWLVGNKEAMAIHTKSIETSSLTISADQASWIKIVMIGIVPCIYLLYGILELVMRRRKA